jgi:hypothetical protein
MAKVTPLKKLLALEIPPRALEREGAKEALRVWVVDDDAEVSFGPKALPDPASWGVLLVDIARQVAFGFSKDGEMSYEDAITQLFNTLAAEFERAVTADFERMNAPSSQEH